MSDVEDAELVDNLFRISTLAKRVAANIVTELDTTERCQQLADVMDEASKELRSRVVENPPVVIEAPRHFSNSGPGDYVGG